MNKKIMLFSFLIVVMSFNGSAQQSCEVLESQQAELAEENTVLERGMTLDSDQAVITGSEGVVTFLCSDQIVNVGPDSQGEIREVGEVESLDSNASVDSDVEISEALKKTEEMEQNLDKINEQVDQNLPGPLKSLVLGDRVNFKVDNTTLGIKSNESEITGFEQGGVDNPTLEISMEEDKIEEILESNNTMDSFSQAYEGDAIQVEAHSFRNKVVFGAVNLANKAYGFFSGLM